MKRWAIFIVVIFVVGLVGNWFWKELSPNQYGPLADVTWKTSGLPNTVHVHLEDEQGRPLVATLLTIYTDDNEYDFTTNMQGDANIVCTGQVLFGIESQHRTVFSKSLAMYTGSPSLADGLDFHIVAKRPDLISRGAGIYDEMKREEELLEVLKKNEEARKTEDVSADEGATPPTKEKDVEESTQPSTDSEDDSTAVKDSGGEQ
ncbi:hypothetical protein [Symmachiella macrocystis]|uniref:hypothetical protein n=1 Tax=Symmachiella macrocystis TaxID=2527985 RepID=UPI0011B736AB|nr:hypothetical protein [Symmachiella macrocystis]